MKGGMLTALVGSLALLGSVSARTPDVAKIHAGGGADRTVKADNGDVYSDCESSGSERLSGERQQQPPRNLCPPSFYRALSRRSVGRYLLATSSLVGECARVYTPAPLSLAASSLWNGFGMGLHSQGRDHRGSLGQNKSSGFSYDRYMSPNDRAGNDEDLPGCDAFSASFVPPRKYSRVSSAFLARHEIGDTEGLEEEEKELGDGKTDPAPPPLVSDDMSHDQPNRGIIRTRRQSPQTSTGSMLKSFASLGLDRNNRAMDDTDLLSDSEDGDGCDREGGMEKTFGDVLSSRTLVSDTSARTGTTSAEPTITRNLVDSDDDGITLVNRLRLGKKTSESSHLRSRRKARRSRQLKNEL